MHGVGFDGDDGAREGDHDEEHGNRLHHKANRIRALDRRLDRREISDR